MRGSSLKFGVRSAHFTSSHASFSCAHVVCLILRDFSNFPLFAVYLLSYRLVFPLGHQLHLPRCGGQILCALQLMRTLAPLPSTTLSQLRRMTVACGPHEQHQLGEEGEAQINFARHKNGIGAMNVFKDCRVRLTGR